MTAAAMIVKMPEAKTSSVRIVTGVTLGVFLFLAVLLIALRWWIAGGGSGVPVGSASRSGASAVSRAAAPQPADYRERVKEAVGELLDTRTKLPTQLSAERIKSEGPLIKTTKGNILSLVVPLGEKDVHLDLVLALTRIEEGMGKNDVVTWRAGEALLDKFLTENPWAVTRNQ